MSQEPITPSSYVHGYSENESECLSNQARTLTDLLHQDTIYPEGYRVLEDGCGIGAQTVILAGNSPGALITRSTSRRNRSGGRKSGLHGMGSGCLGPDCEDTFLKESIGIALHSFS